MSLIDGLVSHYRLFGSYGVALVGRSRLTRKNLEVAVQVAGMPNPVRLRLRTTDVSVFEEIILEDEYRFDASASPRVIVDAGANIGMTSVYFANRYPDATIIALEPEACNFAMLQKNAASYPNIRPVLGALWKENARLDLRDPGTGSWGFQTKAVSALEDTANTVRGMTMETLMDEHRCTHIDVLKIDIEGSEKEVFESSASWIDKVGMIIVELHDRLRPGCSRSVYTATRDFEVEWRKGESTYFARRRDTAAPTYRAASEADPGPGARPPSNRTRRARIAAIMP